jgi:hypothetical protein
VYGGIDGCSHSEVSGVQAVAAMSEYWGAGELGRFGVWGALALRIARGGESGLHKWRFLTCRQACLKNCGENVLVRGSRRDV